MVSSVRSLGIQGVGGYGVGVECFISNGLPAFEVVGLPDTAVKEARERVRAAMKNCGLGFPASRLTVNLARPTAKKPARFTTCPSCSKRTWSMSRCPIRSTARAAVSCTTPLTR